MKADINFIPIETEMDPDGVLFVKEMKVLSVSICESCGVPSSIIGADRTTGEDLNKFLAEENNRFVTGDGTAGEQ